MAQQDNDSLQQLVLAKDNYETINTAFEGDLWERKALGEHLTRYVDRLKVGAVLALDARWGEGKTWFARHWQKHLEQTEHQVIYLDAFANDYLDDPFLIISSEIASTLENNTDPDLLKSFKQKAAKAYQVLLPNLPQLIIGLGLNLIGAGFLSSTVKKTYEGGKDLVDGIAESLSEQIKENIEKKIEDYETEKQSLNSFKDSLRDLAKKLDKPLVFIIDELDRCRPDFSIRMIERIKHFFDIPNIIFVLVMDKTQLTKVICHNYGYDNEVSEEYLDKFIDFTIGIQSNNILEKNNYEKIISQSLLNLGIDIQCDQFLNLQDDILIHCLALKLSIRQIKKNLNIFSLISLNNKIKNQLLLLMLFANSEFRLSKSSEDLYKAIFDYYQKFLISLGYDREVWSDMQNYQISGRQVTIEKLYAEKLRREFGSNLYYKLHEQYEVALNYEGQDREEKLNELSFLPLNQFNDFRVAWKQYIKTGL